MFRTVSISVLLFALGTITASALPSFARTNTAINTPWG